MARKSSPRSPKREAIQSSENMLFSDASSRSLGYQIRYLYRAFVKALAIELSPYGITTSQWSALRMLWRVEGISQVELAQMMLVEKASLTPVLEGLVAQNLIVRRKNPDDRRKMSIFLTPAGRKLKADILPLGSVINKRAMRGISAADVERIRKLMPKIMSNLQD